MLTHQVHGVCLLGWLLGGGLAAWHAAWHRGLIAVFLAVAIGVMSLSSSCTPNMTRHRWSCGRPHALSLDGVDCDPSWHAATLATRLANFPTHPRAIISFLLTLRLQLCLWQKTSCHTFFQVSDMQAEIGGQEVEITRK